MLSTTTCVHFSLNGIWLFLHNIECSVIRLFGHYCKYISLVLEKISCVVLMLHAIVIHSTTFSSTFRRSAFCAKKHKDHIHLLTILFCMICYAFANHTIRNLTAYKRLAWRNCPFSYSIKNVRFYIYILSTTFYYFTLDY